MDPNIFMLMLGAAVDTAAPSGFAELTVAFVTLCVLEIVLGIDNVIFISILAGKLPPEQQPRARFIGLSLAMITRVLLLMSIAWMARLTYPLFSIFQNEVSGRGPHPDHRRDLSGLEEHSRDSPEARGRRRTRHHARSGLVQCCHHPDHPARHCFLTRLGDYCRWDGQ
jgi:predicted tellurium resistance membrane protein TerC